MLDRSKSGLVLIFLFWIAIVFWGNEAKAQNLLTWAHLQGEASSFQTLMPGSSRLNSSFGIIHQKLTVNSYPAFFALLGLVIWNGGILTAIIGNFYFLKIGGNQKWGTVGITMGLLGLILHFVWLPSAISEINKSNLVYVITSLVIHGGLFAFGIWNVVKKNSSRKQVLSLRIVPWGTIGKQKDFRAGLSLRGHF